MSQRREVGEDGKELMFDHEAPFFSVTNPNAISLVHEWESLGFVSQWKQVFGSFDSASNMFLGFQQEGDHTNNNKYVGVPGMNSISKTLCNHSDLSHVFASVNRSINFIDHTSDLSWKDFIYCLYLRESNLLLLIQHYTWQEEHNSSLLLRNDQHQMLSKSLQARRGSY
ncbi:uncharacterized protein LOC108810165 isoform X1 [Raphanus sativus]|uniref:Uncharacterized protein LOC108810165 isoform X1 n=1 Tax=Raphanus sativus TaxID=3726 RepID=A0A9W3DRB0_RAPSA|nr:uncharacterized protein LOC108810165 isoform X1 [Raphanus sativus]